jgi:histidinol-phosphate phosphatase family protein
VPSQAAPPFSQLAARVDPGWTLFLDRDGVLNVHRPDDYVKTWDEWEWVPGSALAVARLTDHFRYIIIITNQQGVGKGLMSEEELVDIHTHMELGLKGIGARVDAVYYCTDLASSPDNQRKPRPDMGLAAQADFEGIDFARAIMVGDSSSDMAFGRNLGLYTVRIHPNPGQALEHPDVDYAFRSLAEFADALLGDNK